MSTNESKGAETPLTIPVASELTMDGQTIPPPNAEPTQVDIELPSIARDPPAPAPTPHD